LQPAFVPRKMLEFVASPPSISIGISIGIGIGIGISIGISID